MTESWSSNLPLKESIDVSNNCKTSLLVVVFFICHFQKDKDPVLSCLAKLVKTMDLFHQLEKQCDAGCIFIQSLVVINIKCPISHSPTFHIHHHFSKCPEGEATVLTWECSLLISVGNTNWALFILFRQRSPTNRAVTHRLNAALAAPLTLS